MIDREGWLITICLVIPGMILIASMIYAGIHISSKHDECVDQNGVLVKTAGDGYVCVDRSVLK
jgi:hypothetical protein